MDRSGHAHRHGVAGMLALAVTALVTGIVLMGASAPLGAGSEIGFLSVASIPVVAAAGYAGGRIVGGRRWDRANPAPPPRRLRPAGECLTPLERPPHATSHGDLRARRAPERGGVRLSPRPRRGGCDDHLAL